MQPRPDPRNRARSRGCDHASGMVCRPAPRLQRRMLRPARSSRHRITRHHVVAGQEGLAAEIERIAEAVGAGGQRPVAALAQENPPARLHFRQQGIGQSDRVLLRIDDRMGDAGQWSIDPAQPARRIARGTRDPSAGYDPAPSESCPRRVRRETILPRSLSRQGFPCTAIRFRKFANRRPRSRSGQHRSGPERGRLRGSHHG